jgi:GntR family transcriptional regulator, rspAB operon transcriptional repressor
MKADGAPPADRKPTAGEEVYRACRRDLIMLAFRPGAALAEQELAERYGTSRVPVREACRRLQQEGLLTAVPYKGYFVTQISMKQISDCFDLRIVLETYAIDLAVERATAGELDELATLAAVEYTYHDRESYARFLDKNLDFHLRLAALSGNERLVGTLADLLSSMQRFFFLGLDLGDYGAEMRAEHECLLGALRRRDATDAHDCLSRQICRSRDRIVRALLASRVDLPAK